MPSPERWRTFGSQLSGGLQSSFRLQHLQEGAECLAIWRLDRTRFQLCGPVHDAAPPSPATPAVHRRPDGQDRGAGDGSGADALKVSGHASAMASRSSAIECKIDAGDIGSGAHLAKLMAQIKHSFSGLSHMRQCGDDVFRP